MKTLVCSLLTLSLGALCAAPDPAPAAAPQALPLPAGKTSPKKIDKARLQEVIYKRTGGKLKKPGVQRGRLVYVNAQKRAPEKWLVENAKVFAENSHLEIQVVEGEFSFPEPKIVGEASLFVIDDPKLPSLLHAPEARWTMVNVAPLATGAGEKPAYFAARVQKQLTRGFALLAGTQTSNYPNSLLGCVTNPDGLDHFTDCRLPVDILARFVPYVAGYGVTPYVVSTYRKACQEGWAPQPTNDVQKAIWDEVHELPSEPITIKKK